MPVHGTPSTRDGPVRLAAFDLDGTLLRGETACEAIAKGIGRIERMRELEHVESTNIEDATAAIEEMATWYSGFTFGELSDHLTTIRVAPGVDEGLALLRDRGFKIAIVALTWEFAVEWFANRFRADYWVGTGISPDGRITHFWPKDKALWLARLAHTIGVDMRDVTAVGDSKGDIPMLLSVGHRYWVGETIPPELDREVTHEPGGDMRLVARRIVEEVGRRRMRL